MQFEDIARKVIEKECEDYFLGIADLSSSKQVSTEKYISLLNIYPRAVSIGITLPPKTMENSSMSNCSALYNETNNQLNNIAIKLSSLIEKQGYKAVALLKAGRMSDGIFVSLHKLAACDADLGRIEDDMVITPEVGPEVNWGTVLTDAPLEVVNK